MTVSEREVLRGELRALGFDVVRFAPVPADVGGDFDGWLEAGCHAEMAWMERGREKRTDVRTIVPGAASVICLGVNYAHAGEAGRQGRWAKYALYRDYHDTMGKAIRRAGRLLEERFGLDREHYRGYVDTGPVLERGWAAVAGIGWQGKNAMLISREYGNWLFLAEIITTLAIPPDPPLGAGTAGAAPRLGHHCGRCTACLEACPTQAFPRPGWVDARRCVSYLTIEHRGIIPRALREGIGPRVFGCDVCLDVCPWNRFARAGRSVLLQARTELAALTLLDLLRMDQARFSTIFSKTAIKRTKLVGLLRNACIAAGNWRTHTDWHFGGVTEAAVVEQLVVLAGHEDAVVRAHAVWAVFHLLGTVRANKVLASARTSESDARVISEYQAWQEPTL